VRWCVCKQVMHTCLFMCASMIMLAYYLYVECVCVYGCLNILM